MLSFAVLIGFIIPQFCKHFNRFAGSNLSKAPKRCASRAPRGNASTKFRKTSESKKESSKAHGPDLRTVACAKAHPNLALNLHKPIRCPRGIGAVQIGGRSPAKRKGYADAYPFLLAGMAGFTNRCLCQSSTESCA